ncbi:MAG: 30S ribosome-binding factor RbfA [Eubacteriales bacterium]|nr:30S ribosome-binding factor RbfA [Eubacteriales bacterium]MCI6971274.1 30S ribosome-binding factor RbfA [Eubacterium sp.]
MAKYRRARVNDEVGRVVAQAIRSVKDPRVAGEMITVTHCDVSGDLKYAKVYFSVYGADAEKIKEIKKGLYSAAGFIRHTVAETLNMRATPEFNFEYDDAIKRGADIFELLKKTGVTSDDEKENEGDGEQ